MPVDVRCWRRCITPTTHSGLGHSVVATGLAEVDGSRRGIHVFWSGPPAYLFCPDGWRVERRRAKRPDVNSDCDALEGATFARLRSSGELAAGQGGWTWRAGRWPDGTKSEIITLESTRSPGSWSGCAAAGSCASPDR